MTEAQEQTKVSFDSGGHRIQRATLVVIPTGRTQIREEIELLVSAVLSPYRINDDRTHGWWENYKIGGRYSGPVPDISWLGDSRDWWTNNPPDRLISPELFVTQSTPQQLLTEMSRLSDDLTAVIVDPRLGEEQFYENE